jgi:N-acetylglucosaminyldiphosphoundecaprenol N-acetyl-beta-D-mannosaminyltransferase
MTAHWNPQYAEVLATADLVTPDGMPLVWALRLLGVANQQRVYGPDLMLAWCKRAAQTGLSIYLYGSTSAQLLKIQSFLTQKFPEIVIAGAHAPPFRPLTPEEEFTDVAMIRESGASVVFVALGCPKQECWMHRQVEHLDAVMIGVGAAFSFFSGTVSQAPRWMMGLGLEWLYRLSQEPRRLTSRYLVYNPTFILLFAGQLLKEIIGVRLHQCMSSQTHKDS